MYACNTDSIVHTLSRKELICVCTFADSVKGKKHATYHVAEEEEEEDDEDDDADDEEEEEDDDDDGNERLPPHELLAREYSQSQRITFSVCEGVGRTLKGRDLSRVRNAVWSHLGFAD